MLLCAEKKLLCVHALFNNIVYNEWYKLAKGRL